MIAATPAKWADQALGGLGRKGDAIREVRQAVDLMPIVKDSLAGPYIATHLALVYAWTGERN